MGIFKENNFKNRILLIKNEIVWESQSVKTITEEFEWTSLRKISLFKNLTNKNTTLLNNNQNVIIIQPQNTKPISSTIIIIHEPVITYLSTTSFFNAQKIISKWLHRTRWMDYVPTCKDLRIDGWNIVDLLFIWW